jgi:two-component system, OmpR family, sensor histidine kinase KdpD
VAELPFAYDEIAVPRKILRFAASLLLVAAIVALYRAIPQANNTTVALTLLLAVLAISARWGLAEATLASVAAVLGFNFYFLPPVGTFTIQEPQNQIVFIAFLVTAATASQLSARARRRTAEAEARRLEIQRLYDLVQTTMLTGNSRKTIGAFIQKIVQVFECRGAAFYHHPTGEFFRSGPETHPITDHDLRAAAEVPDAASDPVRDIATSPVRLGGRTLGGMALLGPLPTEPMVRAVANLLAISIEKARALEDASHAEAARQSEILKAALLDALAHDIKTPLTSIKAAVTGLISSPREPDRELLTIINEEADRLNQIAAEVIAMSRIEAGKVHLDKQPVDPEELLSNVLADLKPSLHGRAIDVRIQPALPPAAADPEFIQQVVKQLLENAVKYTPATSPITVSAVQNNGKIVIGVADAGPGIEENERALIFDKFFRGRRHRFETKGTGMGLAIAKGIVEAHRERIWVESEPGQGSAFYFTLTPYGGRNL